MSHARLSLMIVLLVGSAQALAAQAPPAMSPLPPERLALAAIEHTPEVREAAAVLQRAEAEARLRAAGPHETVIQVIPQRRRVRGGPSFNEWEAEISRAVRWPGKARLDRAIGSHGVEVAQLQLADAHHAGARRLLALWSDWLRAAARASVRQRQVALWERDRKAIARRVTLGDAAQRDLLAADAELARSRADALEADTVLQESRIRLLSRFPRLPLPERVPAGARPDALEGTPAGWVGTILARSHEIGAARARVKLLQAQARRVRADRLADPTLGLRVLNDLGGRERAVGLVLSIPIGVRQRSAKAAAAAADALEAQAWAAMVRRDVSRDAREAVTRARAAQAIWQRYAQAARAATDSAARIERAYSLGESGLAELLTARRTALEAQLSEQRARIDAIEAVARVRVDAHGLWHHHTGGSDVGGHAQGDSGLRLPDL